MPSDFLTPLAVGLFVLFAVALVWAFWGLANDPLWRKK